MLRRHDFVPLLTRDRGVGVDSGWIRVASIAQAYDYEQRSRGQRRSSATAPVTAIEWREYWLTQSPATGSISASCVKPRAS